MPHREAEQAQAVADEAASMMAEPVPVGECDDVATTVGGATDDEGEEEETATDDECATIASVDSDPYMLDVLEARSVDVCIIRCHTL